VCCQFYLLNPNNVIKSRTLPIQPQKYIDKYSKHLTLKMPIISQNRSGDDLTAFWEIWSASGRLLDNQAPDKHVKKKVSGASLARWDFYLSRPLSASSARMLFPSPIAQSDVN